MLRGEPPGSWLSNPVPAKERRFVSFRKALSEVFVGVSEGLKADDRMHILADIGGETWSILCRRVSWSFFGDPHHFDRKTLLNLCRGRSSIDARGTHCLGIFSVVHGSPL